MSIKVQMMITDLSMYYNTVHVFGVACFDMKHISFSYDDDYILKELHPVI